MACTKDADCPFVNNTVVPGTYVVGTCAYLDIKTYPAAASDIYQGMIASFNNSKVTK